MEYSYAQHHADRHRQMAEQRLINDRRAAIKAAIRENRQAQQIAALDAMQED